MLNPLISIVIASSRKDRNKLSACLDSIYKGSFPAASFEVIVVDSGAGDEAKDYLLETAKSRPNLVPAFPGFGNIGPARARNIGIKLAKSSLVAFTDDDISVDPQWLEKITKAFLEHPEVAAVGGMTLPPDSLRRNPFAEYESSIYQRYLKNGCAGSYLSTTRDEHPVFTGNIAYRKEVLEKAGGFSENFPPFVYGEDGDLKERVLKMGGRFLYIDSVNYHNTEYSLASFWQKEEKRGAGILRYRKDHYGTSRLTPLRSGSRDLKGVLHMVMNLIHLKGVKNIMGMFILGLAVVARQVGKIRYYGKV
ncbi:MAG: glycosyltransferase [Patescibacteria group bacterium]